MISLERIRGPSVYGGLFAANLIYGVHGHRHHRAQLQESRALAAVSNGDRVHPYVFGGVHPTFTADIV